MGSRESDGAKQILKMQTSKVNRRRSVSKVKKGKKGKDDDKVASAKADEQRKEIFDEIVEKTGLSQDEVKTAEKEFYANYPSGEITKDEFIEQSDVGFLSESLFKAFEDKENKGKMNFKTFML